MYRMHVFLIFSDRDGVVIKRIASNKQNTLARAVTFIIVGLSMLTVTDNILLFNPAHTNCI